jgi:hypothetical protein
MARQKEMKMLDSLIRRAALIAIWVVMPPSAWADQYLVVASEGPGFTSPQEALEILEKGIMPTFDALLKLEEKKVIKAGGLPVGDRAFVFVMEASSNDEADRILRDIPAWGVFKWKITPLQSIQGRAMKERSVLEALKQNAR